MAPRGAVDAADLSTADFEAMLGIVAELAAPRSLDALRRTTVGVLPMVIASDHPAWNEVDPATGRITAVLPPDFERRYRDDIPRLADRFATNVGDHPVITHSRKTGDGRPRAISDFLTAEEFHATRLYQDFYAVIGTEDQISFVLPAADVTVGITVDRPRRGFDARDRWVLNAIRPHLVQAYRNAFAFERARQVVRTIGTACDSGGRPVIVLDPRGAVEYQTPEAARWLRRLAVQDWTTLMEWARQPQRRDAPEWPLAIGGCAVRRAWCDEWTVLTLNDGAVATCRGLQRVGLTGREAEVMLLISEGLASKEVALRLALSPRTVDKHVANALSKLGVHNRVAAVNLVRQAAEGGTGDPEARHQLGAALRQ